MIKDIINTDGPVDMIFMVKQSTRAVSNNGSPYLSLILQDISGTIDAKMWQIEDSDIELTTPGSLVRVNGLVGMYKGHPQLKINELAFVDQDSVDMSKFIPTAPRSIDDMKKELKSDIELIQDDELKKLTITLLKENFEAYTTYPAAVTVHHAYLGGLLYHSLSICSLAIKVQEHYPFLSLDYLVSGSLLHDIGKTKELSGPKAATYTDEGNLLGHISLGAMMVYQKGQEMKISPEKLDVLTHMVLAHHGEPDFGSPKIPATPEAYVLHALDDLDAKMEILFEAFKTTEEGTFTTKIPWMENISYFKPHSLNKDKK